jgi:hypothetical protein
VVIVDGAHGRPVRRLLRESGGAIGF